MQRRELIIRSLGLFLLSRWTLARGADEKKSPRQVRAEILAMRKATLAQLYKESPEAQKKVRGAAGYAVFDTVGAQILFVGGSGGVGVVRDNLTGRDTYMKMASAGVGIGLGAKEVRLVLVFHKRDTLRRFAEEGWQFGGQAGVAAKTGDKGAAAGELEVAEGITAYQLTQSGLILEGMVKGTKYWKDDTLN